MLFSLLAVLNTYVLLTFAIFFLRSLFSPLWSALEYQSGHICPGSKDIGKEEEEKNHPTIFFFFPFLPIVTREGKTSPGKDVKQLCDMSRTLSLSLFPANRGSKKVWCPFFTHTLLHMFILGPARRRRLLCTETNINVQILVGASSSSRRDGTTP